MMIYTKTIDWFDSTTDYMGQTVPTGERITIAAPVECEIVEERGNSALLKTIKGDRPYYAWGMQSDLV